MVGDNIRVAVVMRGGALIGSGGAERRYARITRHLADKGYDVHLILNATLARGLVESGVIELAGKCIHVIDDQGKTGVLSALRFGISAIRQIGSLSPDVIHLPLIQKSLIPFYIWLYTQREPRVVCSVALANLSQNGEAPLSTLVTAKLMWARASAIDSLYAGFTQTYGRTYKLKTYVSPGSFTDTKRYAATGLKQKSIVFAGRLSEPKNPLLLVEALDILVKTRPGALDSWQVFILGEGPLKPAIVKRISTNSVLSQHVIIEGVPSTEPFLSRSMIFVSLQRFENYPSQSLLEAMACENAVIATDVGETRRLVDDQVGILVSPSAADLAEALYSLISDEQRLSLLGSAARLRICQNHGINSYASYILGVWMATTGGKRPI